MTLLKLKTLSSLSYQQAVHLHHLKTAQSWNAQACFLSLSLSQRQQVSVKPSVCTQCASVHTASSTSWQRLTKCNLNFAWSVSQFADKQQSWQSLTNCNLNFDRSLPIVPFKGSRSPPPLLYQIHTARETHLKSAQRAYSTVQPSSLFVSGADDSYQSPVQVKLDLETLLSAQNVDKLRRNLNARGLDFDLDQLIADYKLWQEVDELKTKLETQRSSISKAMAVLVKDKKSENVPTRKEELTKRGKAVKEQLRETMPLWYSAEEKVTLQSLKLPTDLHPLAQPEADTEVDIYKGAASSADGTSHIQIAEEQGLLKFSNVGPRAAYLLGELAELEQSLLHYAATVVRERGFSPFAGSEIFRTVVVEGCGMDQRNAEEIFTLHQREEDHQDINAYHLKGNSLLSYTAFFAKTQVKAERLPMKFCSIGRHYGSPTAQDFPGLYGAVQSNRVTMFAACACGDTATELHDEMVGVAWDIVQGLGLPARKLLVSAKRLEQSESLRTDIEVWAPSLQQYVQMGHVSLHNDYPSSRLLSRAQPQGTPLHMVCGVVLDVARVLASILEHSGTQGQFELMKLPCLHSKS
ncbi:serine--tRNA synthetase-like protein Slimp isoform X2 [Littorina saxatilis]|uniref:serine--tRNA synthetase-like protein Slimp isoform X2 n=1 Tax=Littorina saxatilis TaxID=31220 RepID=UPI0038B64B77